RMKQERYAEAREALERAVAGDPGSPKAHYQLSLAYARLGDEQSARREVGLYQAKLKEIEERVSQIRSATGLSGSAGMGPGGPRSPGGSRCSAPGRAWPRLR